MTAAACERRSAGLILRGVALRFAAAFRVAGMVVFAAELRTLEVGGAIARDFDEGMPAPPLAALGRRWESGCLGPWPLRAMFPAVARSLPARPGEAEHILGTAGVQHVTRLQPSFARDVDAEVEIGEAIG